MSENNNNNEMGPRERRYRQQQQQNPHLKHRRKRPWLVGLLIALGVLIVAGVYWGTKTWNTAKDTMNTTYQATGSSKLRNVDAVLKRVSRSRSYYSGPIPGPLAGVRTSRLGPIR